MRKGWNPAGSTVTAGAMIIPVIIHFGTAQSNSKDHFTPGNAFFALYAELAEGCKEHRAGQVCQLQFALVFLCWELGRALQLLCNLQP